LTGIDHSTGLSGDGYVEGSFLGVVFRQFGFQLRGEVGVLLDRVKYET